MVRYSFLVRLSHPLLHTGLSRRILDHLIGSHEHQRWDRQAQSLSSFKVDHQFELRRLLYWKIGGFGTFQNFVYIVGSATKSLKITGGIRHETTSLYPITTLVHRRKPVLKGQVGNLFPLNKQRRTRSYNDRAHTPLGRGFECSFDIRILTGYLYGL